ncbi:phage tail spike protein [Faecalibacillus intestinalis]|uniref:phage tail spike protein n=1 Tax=Faecalibacillus intestinalis TaxID=1982626 RepID=UPI002E78C662|nr:phage tail spike protein [Faecalibacillus intestinalis]MED9808870.1 phage tail spike protein [Faecalibacillus intestinalis]
MNCIRIAVLSAYDEVCTFLDNSITKAMHYWNDELHTYLKGGAYTYSFKTFTDYEDAQYLTVGNKISFIYKDKGYYLNIVNVDRDEVYTTVTAYGLSLELTNEETGPYKATGAMSFEQYINAFNFEKPFVIGVNEVSDKRITHEWEGTETILARLFSLANVFDAELEFITELDRNYSLKRIVMNIYREHDSKHQGLGNDKRGQGNIRYGKEITGISKKSDITELYTAIRPTGTDGLTLLNLDKKEYDDDGNLEYSSPKGTIEILAPQARDRFPSTLMAGINGRYICKVWSYDTDNPETLYGQALAQLKKNCIPQVSYTVDGYIDAEIGDTFIIEDSEYAPTLYLEARITEQSISFTNRDNCKTTFDNFEELQSQINESLIDEMKLLINANKMYDASIITSNGSVFKNDTDSTVLTALIRENGVDITEALTVFWYKNGNKILEQKSVSVIATDFIEKAVYKFEAFKDEQIKATCEITIINVRDGKDGPKGDKGETGAKGDDAITLYIESSNGNTFKNSDIATTLTAHVYKGATELTGAAITALGTIKWYKDGGTTSIATGQTFTVSAGDVTNKATYTAQLEG